MGRLTVLKEGSIMIADLENLITRKNEIVNEAILWLKANYPKRTSSYNKCVRDIGYVIDAYIVDLTNNTSKNIIGIGNKFWVNNVRQINSYQAEIAVHNYIVTYISRFITTEQLINQITSLKNIFVSIIETGPVNQQDFLQLTNSMQRCQRNFDLKKTISNDIVNQLYDVGYSTPTKQNLNSFQIVAFTQRNQIFEIAKTATSIYDEFSDQPPKVKREIISGKRMQNPQVNANVLFMFFHRSESRTSALRIEREGKTGDTPEFWRSVTNFEMGLSASAIALAAHSMGFKTGFCRCFDRAMLDKIINPLGLSSDDFSVSLGIGYPIVGLPHTLHTSRRHRSFSYEKEPFTRMIF